MAAPMGFPDMEASAAATMLPTANSYGAAVKSPFVRRQQSRMSSVGMLVNLVVPCILFVCMAGTYSYDMRYYTPGLCYCITGVALVVVLNFANLAKNAYNRRNAGDSSQNPAGLVFLSVASFIAVAAGVMVGELNFWSTMRSYYDVINMNNYPDIDPSVMKGQEVMDAGRITFKEGSKLDTRYAMGFKNADLYCVVPITIGDDPLQNYDFWAVGLNCCEGGGSDFHCGEFEDSSTHSGLRLMKDDQADYFRLAVNQAEASYNIVSRHPLFFLWMKEASNELTAWEDDAMRFLSTSTFGFTCWQLFLVICASFVL